MTSESGQLRRLRRDADDLGLTLRKIPERSRWHVQYGPYMLLDPRAGSGVVASGLDLEDVEKWLDAHRHESEKWQREQGDDDPRVRHSVRFRKVSTLYPRLVAEAYGGDLGAAEEDDDETVAARVAAWEAEHGVPAKDWATIGADEQER